ncbi:MAG TPA: CpsD/CapB family tyrosine-protein kinase, partial [Acidimicrobiia bacterium]|nr:CpsD/CapB family tyrosine-protein kinase [Acidimicrobiia bacterium]
AESLDDSIKTPDDLERHADGIPFLGDLPRADTKRSGDRVLVALDDPDSVPAEAFRSLRTSLQVVQLRQPLQTLLITSAASGEGKSTVAANLAVTLARANKKVVLVDLDLRKPTIAQIFGLPPDQGFSSVLLGEREVEDAMFTVAVQPGTPLRVLPAGTAPANPSELLGTKWLGELLARIRTEADIVLIDSPPLLRVTDSMVLAPQVDGVLLVTRSGVTSQRSLTRATGMLAQAGAPTIGAVLNDVHGRAGYGYGYGDGYGHGYGHETTKKARSKKDERARLSKV